MNFDCLEMKRDRLDPKVRVQLEGLDLWKQFNSLGTEMIITKYVEIYFLMILMSKTSYIVETVDDYFQHFVFLLVILIRI